MAGPVAADALYPPGLRVGLEPPQGMIISPNFAGFEDAERRAAISILDLPAVAYAELENALFNTPLKDPAVSEVKRESFPFRGGIGQLLSFRQVQDGASLHKWILLASSTAEPAPDLTAMIAVEIPERSRSAYPDAVIRSALASISFRPMPIEEQLALLPFKLGELSGFHVVRGFPGSGLLLTAGPRNDSNTQPNMVISIEPGGPAQADDRAAFSQHVLATAPLRDVTIVNAEAMRISGQPGYEIRAEGRELGGDLQLAVVQWLRFGTGGYLRIVGISRKEDWDQAFPQFRAVRDGLQLR